MFEMSTFFTIKKKKKKKKLNFTSQGWSWTAAPPPSSDRVAYCERSELGNLLDDSVSTYLLFAVTCGGERSHVGEVRGAAAPLLAGNLDPSADNCELANCRRGGCIKQGVGISVLPLSQTNWGVSGTKGCQKAAPWAERCQRLFVPVEGPGGAGKYSSVSPVPAGNHRGEPTLGGSITQTEE